MGLQVNGWVRYSIYVPMVTTAHRVGEAYPYDAQESIEVGMYSRHPLTAGMRRDYATAMIRSTERLKKNYQAHWTTVHSIMRKCLAVREEDMPIAVWIKCLQRKGDFVRPDRAPPFLARLPVELLEMIATYYYDPLKIPYKHEPYDPNRWYALHGNGAPLSVYREECKKAAGKRKRKDYIYV